MALFERAIEDFDRAVKLEPHYADVYYYRGLCKIELEDYDDAIEDFLIA